MNDMHLADSISRRIDERDRYHTLSFRKRIKRSGELNEELDEFVLELSSADGMSFCGLGELWQETNEVEARTILQRILSHDLAFCTPELPVADAENLSEEFIGLFDRELRFFTNGHFSEDYSSWSGCGHVAKATFETGVVVIDRLHIGLIWCHDEG